MHVLRFPTRTAALAAALLCISNATAAACLPGASAKLYVGNMADSRCNFASIQDAIAGTICPDTTIFVTNTQDYSGQAIRIQNKSVTIQGFAGACGTWQSPVCDPDNGCGGSSPRMAIG
jgi:hypothetical protein